MFSYLGILGLYLSGKGEVKHSEDCIISALKLDDESIMIWSCMPARDVSELFLCKMHMNSNCYLNMLEEVLKSSVVKLSENIFFNKTSPHVKYKEFVK